jgi:hypothetical protein
MPSPEMQSRIAAFITLREAPAPELPPTLDEVRG